MEYTKNDFELLYYINNKCHYSVEKMLDKYNPLVWKNTFSFKMYSTPQGVEHQDLYQEGCIALHDSFYSFKSLISVPFFAFTNVCISRKMKGYVRRFNSEASRLFYNSLSLDMTVTEDHNVYLHEMVAEDSSAISAFKLYCDDLKDLIDDDNVLSKFEADVLVLKILGYSYEEVGKHLKCSAKKVDNTLQKIKRLLCSKEKA